MRRRNYPETEVTITVLNERGYGIGEVEGKIFWVLNALPGERVIAKTVKRKRGIFYCIALEILKKSPYRINPKEEHFLSCSPWQVLDFIEEQKQKKELIKSHFEHLAGIILPDFEVIFTGNEYHYRNKLEFSFYTNEDEILTLAYHKRDGAKAKYSFETCVLAPDSVNIINKKFLQFLNSKSIQARQLKGIVYRYSYFEKKVVAALFVKDETLVFDKKEIGEFISEDLNGIVIVNSDKKSPAFIETEIKLQIGETDIKEKILDKVFAYSYDGFFQVNPPCFELAIKDMRNFLYQLRNLTEGSRLNTNQLMLIDMYAGVGTIGVLLSDLVQKVISVELFNKSKEYALQNIETNTITNLEFIQDKAENELNILKDAPIVVFDPPRAGLHPKVIKQVLESKPEYIIYLSCNPKTQAENMKALKELYEIEFIRAYNFYPHTPHVENLVILKRR